MGRELEESRVVASLLLQSLLELFTTPHPFAQQSVALEAQGQFDREQLKLGSERVCAPRTTG